MSSGGSPYLITTSLFSHFDDITQSHFVLHYILAGIYLFIGLFSWYTENLARKVSYSTLCATWVSSCYILVWMIFQLQNQTSRLHTILLGAIIFDLLKQFFFLCKAELSSDQNFFSILSGLLFATLFAIFHDLLPIWTHLFPSLILLIPLIIQLANSAENPKPIMTRFQISNWLCMSMWMGYAYLNPGNIFWLSPKPKLAIIFFGIILLQFLTSFCVLWKRRRDHESILAMYRAQTDARIAYWRAQVYNPDNEEPEHRYTIVINKENPTKLKNDCAICFDNLLRKKKEKLYKTPCGHIFHEICLRAWGFQKLVCPCCRHQLPQFR